MSVNTLDQIVSHLQFLGYETTQKDDIRIAKHPKKMNVLLRAFKGGVLLTAINGCKDSAKSDRVGYLGFINTMNRKAAVARFYADQDSDLYMEAWYPDYYDRAKFGTFLDSWESDTTTLLFATADEAIKYLK
jgi:hypothetical protein